MTQETNQYLLLAALAKERLTSKQKKILVHLLSSEAQNVTRLVAELSSKLECSDSAVWNNLNSLKRSMLITFGDRNSKGAPVELTGECRRIAEMLSK